MRRARRALAVSDGGERCYGECVDAEQCLSVPACAACGPGALCLHTPSAPAVTHCVPWPGGRLRRNPGAPLRWRENVRKAAWKLGVR